MDLNFLGLTAALSAFFGIWVGHVSVRKIEALAPDIRLPIAGALFLGLLLEIGAAFSADRHLAVSFGILGVTLLWDGLEFWRQQNRVKKGHAPANPANNRHARILAEYPEATTLDWLDRQPIGRRYSAEELDKLKEAFV